MTTDRDTTRIVRSWLADEGATVLPDRVLDAVLDQLPGTRQRRRPWWSPRRTSHMRSIRLALAAAAVLAVAFLGMRLLPSQPTTNVGGPSASPSVTPSVSPGPVSNEIPFEGEPLVPGTTYVMHPDFPVNVSLVAPEGWTSRSGSTAGGNSIYRSNPLPPNGVGIVITQVPDVYGNACNRLDGLLEPPVGPGVQDLADALGAQARTTVTTPAEPVTLGGYSGVSLELLMGGERPEDCIGDRIARWPTPIGDREALEGQRDALWILDVDGARLVIVVYSFEETSEADLAAARALVEALQISPKAPAPSPSVAP